MVESFPHTPDWFNGSRLWVARCRRGKTRHELASAVGVTPSLIKGLEDNSKVTNMAVIERIASVLEWPIVFFFLDDMDIPHVDWR